MKTITALEQETAKAIVDAQVALDLAETALDKLYRTSAAVSSRVNNSPGFGKDAARYYSALKHIARSSRGLIGHVEKSLERV